MGEEFKQAVSLFPFPCFSWASAAQISPAMAWIVSLFLQSIIKHPIGEINIAQRLTAVVP